jgi:hypothetical protein
MGSIWFHGCGGNEQLVVVFSVFGVAKYFASFQASVNNRALFPH